MLKPSIFAILFIATQAINTHASAQINGIYEIHGNLCLEHIKGRLKDPESAYVRDIVKDGTKFTMTLYAKNSYAAIVPKTIACEIKGNRVDPDWTKIHLERLGW